MEFLGSQHAAAEAGWLLAYGFGAIAGIVAADMMWGGA